MKIKRYRPTPHFLNLNSSYNATVCFLNFDFDNMISSVIPKLEKKSKIFLWILSPHDILYARNCTENQNRIKIEKMRIPYWLHLFKMDVLKIVPMKNKMIFLVIHYPMVNEFGVLHFILNIAILNLTFNDILRSRIPMCHPQINHKRSQSYTN